RGGGQFRPAQPPVKEIEYETQTDGRCRGIVARSLVPQKSVLGVELVPGERDIELREPPVDEIASRRRDVRILPPPDEQQLAGHGGQLRERVIASQPEAPLVDVGRVE